MPYIDPVGIDKTMNADYIFITHAHADHFNLPEINKLLKEESAIICPEKVAEKLSDYTIRKKNPATA